MRYNICLGMRFTPIFRAVPVPVLKGIKSNDNAPMPERAEFLAVIEECFKYYKQRPFNPKKVWNMSKRSILNYTWFCKFELSFRQAEFNMMQPKLEVIKNES